MSPEVKAINFREEFAGKEFGKAMTISNAKKNNE